MKTIDHAAGIAAYYDHKREEIIFLTEVLRRAIEDNADAETILTLRENLENARYTGD